MYKRQITDTIHFNGIGFEQGGCRADCQRQESAIFKDAFDLAINRAHANIGQILAPSKIVLLGDVDWLVVDREAIGPRSGDGGAATLDANLAA